MGALGHLDGEWFHVHRDAGPVGDIRSIAGLVEDEKLKGNLMFRVPSFGPSKTYAGRVYVLHGPIVGDRVRVA